MSVPDKVPDDDDDFSMLNKKQRNVLLTYHHYHDDDDNDDDDDDDDDDGDRTTASLKRISMWKIKWCQALRRTCKDKSPQKPTYTLTLALWSKWPANPP
ncbi:hypothetical protein PoB_003434600 [Plakobranchus ocellatus]|uniref:Uncharacterized protein n=1 Tax=Plakobranchus ocellatus TaxID=259542 RepID=A0AAV4A9H9_9GAST|nr:hypothetical protein PoB_003434600 [Plakobranchus ocellatus]